MTASGGLPSASKRGAHFLGVGDDEVGDALDQRMRQARLDRHLAPCQIRSGVLAGPGLDRQREVHQRFARAGAAVEHHVFDLLAQRRIEVVVHAEHAGIDDAHRQAGPDRVVQEHGVDGFAHGIVAAEAEAHVGDAATRFRVRQVVSNPAHRLDEIDGVVVMLFNAGGNGEDVRVEDDVFGREADADQQLVGALADLGLALKGVCLALFVEGHDDDRGAVVAAQPRLTQEFVLALLHRDRVDHALALNALEAGLDHAPLG